VHQLTEPVFRPASDQALLVTLGSRISLPVHRAVVRLLHAMETAKMPGVLNLHPAYCSLLVRFDSLVTSHEILEGQLRGLLQRAGAWELPEPRVIEIPVHYGGESGPDLPDVAEVCKLSPGDVIDLHASTNYTVYFLGFVPGFAYMGSLPAALAVPRLQIPRKHVPAGSVAIANDHTAIYPIPTPGGWRLIGRTDVQLFDTRRENLSVLNIGDKVRFLPAER
jgi:inhibitor of KinA